MLSNDSVNRAGLLKVGGSYLGRDRRKKKRQKERRIREKKKKKENKTVEGHPGVMTWMWPSPSPSSIRSSGPKHLIELGFSSEDIRLSSSLLDFILTNEEEKN